MLVLDSPFKSIQDPSWLTGPAYIQGGSSHIHDPDVESPSQTCLKLCSHSNFLQGQIPSWMSLQLLSNCWELCGLVLDQYMSAYLASLQMR